jgi:DNA-binding response OmpR family regulator
LLRKRGYTVLIALTGRTAIDTVNGTHVDGAIVDFRIPDMRGDVLHAALVAIQPHLAKRTVFLTGDISDVVSEVLADSGCPIVLKPFDLGELERVVVATIGSADAADGDARADAL